MDNLKSFGQGNCSPGQCECSNAGWEVFRSGGGAVRGGLSKVFVGALHSSPCAAAALWMQNFIHDGSNTQISSINIWEKGFWGRWRNIPGSSCQPELGPTSRIPAYTNICPSASPTVCLPGWHTHTHTHIYTVSHLNKCAYRCGQMRLVVRCTEKNNWWVMEINLKCEQNQTVQTDYSIIVGLYTC